MGTFKHRLAQRHLRNKRRYYSATSRYDTVRRQGFPTTSKRLAEWDARLRHLVTRRRWVVYRYGPSRDGSETSRTRGVTRPIKPPVHEVWADPTRSRERGEPGGNGGSSGPSPGS